MTEFRYLRGRVGCGTRFIFAPVVAAFVVGVLTLTSSAPVPCSPAMPAVGGKLSNGCAYNARGVPSCGAFVGAAVGSNSDPGTFEKQVGGQLGVRRTYWGPSQVDSAVQVAQQDLVTGRLPWISFKLPYPWSAMASGEGDAWARDIAQRLSELDGPVWLAFHHEPEGDGDIKQWTATQARLAPIVRSTARNVAYTIILTGWNQLYGPSQYQLNALWPKGTRVDVAGFDIYNDYGVVKDGKRRLKTTDMRGQYFKPIAAWAKKTGVAWGLAETGYTDDGATESPHWIGDTYRDMVATGGVAFVYFNTPLNSVTSMVLSDSIKRHDFANALKKSPTLP